jgi:hypothetical protein
MSRLYTSTFQQWHRWTKNYTARVIAVAGWAISRRDIMSVSSALKTWQMGINEYKSLILKFHRLELLVAGRTLAIRTRLWRVAVARNKCRSLEFERARCRVNRCILQVLGLWLVRACIKAMLLRLWVCMRWFASEFRRNDRENVTHELTFTHRHTHAVGNGLVALCTRQFLQEGTWDGEADEQACIPLSLGALAILARPCGILLPARDFVTAECHPPCIRLGKQVSESICSHFIINRYAFWFQSDSNCCA